MTLESEESIAPPQLSEEVSEASTARLFYKLTANQVKYSEYHDCWISWDALKQQWSTSEVILYRQIDRVCRMQEAQRHIKLLESSRVRGMLDRASKMDVFRLDKDAVDSDPMLLGVANGVVDLRTGILRENKLSDYITTYSPVAYYPNPISSRFARFMEEIQPDPEVRHYIQKLMGSALTRDTSDQLFHVFLGKGSNGKSKLLDLARDILGPMGSLAPAGLFVKHQDSAMRFAMPRMIDSRLIVSSEVPKQAQMDEQTVKRLTGETVCMVEEKNKPQRDGRIVATIIMLANDMPEVADHSYGMVRRLRIIPFSQRFDPEAEQDISEKLWADREYALWWKIQGAVLWYKERLKPPEAIRIASGEVVSEAMRDDTDIFIEECLEDTPGINTFSDPIYRAYTSWMFPRTPMSQTAFGKLIQEKGLVRGKRQAAGYAYLNISIRPKSPRM